MKPSAKKDATPLPSQRFGFEPQICILDVETTGFNPRSDEIIEIAIMRMDGSDVVDTFSTFVKPKRRIPSLITQLTSITDEDVASAPSLAEVVEQIRLFIGDTQILAHNAAFDQSFVEAACGAFSGAWLDSVEMMRIAFPHLRTHNLDGLVEQFLPERHADLHRAIHDVEALAYLWRLGLCTLAALDLDILQAMARVAPKERWPLAAWIQLIAQYQQGVSGVAKPKPLNLQAMRIRQITSDKQPDFVDAYEHESLTFPDFPEVVAALAQEGIAGRMYPAFESRQEQVDMAVEINDAFATSRHLVVEAGTGVGKSLAYLLPAALVAQRNNITIGIGTKTNTLTDQLMNKELPLLAEALGGNLRYTALKGYEHYLCLHKLEAQLRDLTLEPYEVCVALAWVATHPWGDLESMNFYWKTSARWVLNARSLECAKRKCRFYPNLCYVHGARVRARSSHIVVTNHALLFRDSASSGALLPPLRYLILDEAQGVEGEARRQMSVGIASEELRVQLEQFRRPHAGLVAQLARQAGHAQSQQQEVQDTLDRFELLLMQTQGTLDSFIQAVSELAPAPRAQQYASTDLWIDRSMRESATWGLVSRIGRELHDAIAQSVREGNRIVTIFEQQDKTPPNVVSDFSLALMVWSTFAASLEMCLGDPIENVYYCASIYRPRENRSVPHVELTAANVEMGGLIAQNLLESTNSVVFTSATLAAGNDFSPFTRAVGLDALGADAYQTIQLASSFDLADQMQIFIVNDMAAPTESEYQQQLQEFLYQVHLATQGGVLTLFTNKRDLQMLHQALEEPLATYDLSLLAQSSKAGQRRVRERFIQEPNTSLFATKSFWEGFDAVGETLRCVVISRIPFVQPTDPLAQARKTIDPQSWDHYVLPEALVDLKQAAGRLIRSATDTGCVIIADSRAAHARYAQKIQRALPIKPIIATRDEILQAITKQ